MTKTSTAITGACGEHYVASYLSGYKLIVAMPRAGVPGCDLMVADEKGGHAIQLQVKTGTQSTKNDKHLGPIYLWHASVGATKRSDKNLWYAYVWLNGWPEEPANTPEVYFVPSRAVVKCVKQCLADREWLSFWMRASDAKRYKGQAGLRSLLQAMRH